MKDLYHKNRNFYSRNIFCTTRYVDTLGHSKKERREKKIIKKSKISEMIDVKRKNREEMLGVSTFLGIQITYFFFFYPPGARIEDLTPSRKLFEKCGT